MCIYQVPEKGPKSSCNMANYVNWIRSLSVKVLEGKKYDQLPIDAEGLCVFHSHNIEWKEKNNFFDWMDGLLTYIRKSHNWVDMELDSSPQRVLDLRGTVLIADKESGGKKEPPRLLFEKLSFLEDTHILFDYARILDDIYFRECDFHKVKLSFKKTVIDACLYISNTNVETLAANDSKFNGGVIINQSSFSNYSELAGSVIRGIFQMSKVAFGTHVYFNSNNFRCDTVMLDHVHCKGKADFNLATFHGDVNIEESEFEQQLVFTNARFNGPVVFTGNIYGDNVLFTSSDTGNRMFYDSVNFLFIDKRDEVRQRIIFDNVNYSMIDGPDRQELTELARQNKVTIGPGCIKYRVQSPEVEIKTNNINKNIAEELATSFRNYFISSTGKNLGVEFVENTISCIRLFYFSDEDMSQEDFMGRLRAAQSGYWDAGPPEKSDSAEEISRKVNAVVSKVAVLTRISMFKNYGLFDMRDIPQVTKAINFQGDQDKGVQYIINFIENQNIQNMKINKVIAKANSHVVFADKIDKIEFSPAVQHIPPAEMAAIKQLLTALSDAEMEEVRKSFSSMPKEQYLPSLMEELKTKLNQFAIKHSAPVIQGIASSVIYDVLKFIFGYK